MRRPCVVRSEGGPQPAACAKLYSRKRIRMKRVSSPSLFLLRTRKEAVPSPRAFAFTPARAFPPRNPWTIQSHVKPWVWMFPVTLPRELLLRVENETTNSLRHEEVKDQSPLFFMSLCSEAFFLSLAVNRSCFLRWFVVVDSWGADRSASGFRTIPVPCWYPCAASRGPV